MVSAMWQRQGVLSPTSFKVTQSDTVGWTVTIAGGWAALGAMGPTSHDTIDRYLVVKEYPTIIDLAAGGFTTNPAGLRTHRIYLVAYDKQVNGSASAARIVITEDTLGAGAPSPTNAADWTLLSYLTISPGQSYIHNADIQDSRMHAWPGTYPSTAYFTPSSGMTDAAASTGTAPFLTAIYRNGQVSLSGAVMRSNSADSFAGSNTYDLGTLDLGWRPTNTKAFVCATGPNLRVGNEKYDDFHCRVLIFPSGQVSAYIPDGNTTKYIYLDSVTYDLDV
jgi:hypothetical protein